MQYLESAPLRSASVPLARWIRGTAAALLTLAAPALSTSGALTTGLHGTSPAVGYPPGYAVALAATVVATTLAAALAALIAGRDALIAVPVSLGMWAIIGLSVMAAGIQLGHPGLTGWGTILVAAALIATTAGILLAARSRRSRQQSGPRTRRPARTPPARRLRPQPHNPAAAAAGPGQTNRARRRFRP